MMSLENLLLGVLIFGPYLAFVFFGESLNPFLKPVVYAQRSSWRYGRAMALAVFSGSFCAVVLTWFGNQPATVAMIYGAIVSVVIGTGLSVKRMTERFKS